MVHNLAKILFSVLGFYKNAENEAGNKKKTLR